MIEIEILAAKFNSYTSGNVSVTFVSLSSHSEALYSNENRLVDSAMLAEGAHVELALIHFNTTLSSQPNDMTMSS